MGKFQTLPICSIETESYKKESLLTLKGKHSTCKNIMISVTNKKRLNLAQKQDPMRHLRQEEE